MSRTPIDRFRAREQIILTIVVLAVALGIMMLFAQEKQLYYLIGLIVMGVLAWTQLNIWRWVLLVFIFMPLSPSIPISSNLTGVTLELDDFVVLATIFIFILNLIVEPKKKRIMDYYLIMPLAIFTLTVIFSSFVGFYRHQSYLLIANAIGHYLKWLSYIVMYFIIVRTFTADKDLKNLLRVILISFGIGSLVTVYRYLGHSAELDEIYRAGGLMEGLNGYAVLLAIILIFYFNLFLQGKSKELFPSWLFFIPWSTILVALIITFSRTGWITLWAGILGLSILRKRRYVAVFMIAVALLGFYILRTPVEKRIKMTFEKQASSLLPVDLGGRDDIWKRAIQRIGYRNILGVGFSNFSQVLMGTTAHNQYLALLGETGLLGLVAFLFLLYRMFKSNIYLARNHPLPFYRECAVGSLTALIILPIISMAGEYFYMPTVMAVWLSFYATSYIAYWRAKQTSAPNQPAYSRPPLLMTIGDLRNAK